MWRRVVWRVRVERRGRRFERAEEWGYICFEGSSEYGSRLCSVMLITPFAVYICADIPTGGQALNYMILYIGIPIRNLSM